MIIPDRKSKSLPPESISNMALSMLYARRSFVITVGAVGCAFVALLFAWTVVTKYQKEARLTYVKLSPNGTWSVDQNTGENVEYFDATLRQILYDWIERRYSKRKSTILSDWGIANSMYAPALQKWFVNDFMASQVAAEHAACNNCEDIVVEVRTHQHLDTLPTQIGLVDSAPINTLIYATEKHFQEGSVKPNEEFRKLFKIEWRFLSKATIQSKPELLRYNPLGVQVLNVEVTDDKAP